MTKLSDSKKFKSPQNVKESYGDTIIKKKIHSFFVCRGTALINISKIIVFRAKGIMKKLQERKEGKFFENKIQN